MKNKKRAMLGVLALMLGGTMSLGAFASCQGEGGSPTGGTKEEDPNAPHYSVTLDPNGGAFADGSTEKKTISVQEGFAIDWSKYGLEWEGNDHLGWTYAENGKPFPGARYVTEDTTLKARWSATEEKETYDLTITIAGEELTLAYEAGVYQFYYTGEIYGGYTKRGALYTVYEEELMANASKDDGSAKRILYRAESNYVEATGGEVYALFYNDGAFELFYKYMFQGKWTDYSMLMGYWTNKGYTPPYQAPEAPQASQGICMHEGWEVFYTVEEKPSEGETGETEEKPVEATTAEDAKEIYTGTCSNSETMRVVFFDDNTYQIQYDLSGQGSSGYYAVGTYAYSKDNGLDVGVTLTENEDGTLSFTVDQNTYVVDPVALGVPPKAEAKEIYTVSATNSKTMRVVFMSDGTYKVQYDLSGQGSSGYYTTETHKWKLTDGKLDVEVESVDKGDTVEFTTGGNTYAVTVAELAAARN